MKLRAKLALLVCAFALVGCATVLDEDGALAVAPFRIQPNGQIVIETYVDGRGPFDFAIDTAASISVISDSTRAEQDFALLPGTRVAIQGFLSSGRFPLVDIDKFEIGEEILVNPRVASLPSETNAFRGIDGLLGVDLLHRYALGFSARDRVVRLYAPELVSGRSYAGWRVIRLRPEYFAKSSAAVYVFDVEIRGQKIPALLDLGAGFNLISAVTARRLDYRPRKPPAKEEMSGALESTPVLRRLRVERLSAGGIHWYDTEFTVLDVELFDTYKFGFSPRVVLGSALFTQRDFIIDFARNRLLIKLPVDKDRR